MIGDQHLHDLVAAERQQALRSPAALYHGSQAIDAKRAARRNKRGPSIILRIARRLAHAPTALRPTPAATTAWTRSAAPPA